MTALDELVCAVQGVEHEELFTLDEERGILIEAGTSTNGAGEVSGFAPPGDIHRVRNAPDWLEEWSEQVGTDLEAGMRENPSWIAFALEDGVVYHTYTRSAPDLDFVVPYYMQLLDRTPNGRVQEFRAFRHDEYESARA